mmetsp:Transcript_23591/g.65002  ORF Transcript_23591/g.65002 Transcript_23591/m.65002 type:complete len:108 (-) Transcript_23591:1454-1777(-)
MACTIAKQCCPPSSSLHILLAKNKKLLPARVSSCVQLTLLFEVHKNTKDELGRTHTHMHEHVRACALCVKNALFPFLQHGWKVHIQQHTRALRTICPRSQPIHTPPV